MPDRLPAYAEAFAEWLEECAKRVRNRESVKEVAASMIVPLRVIEGRI